MSVRTGLSIMTGVIVFVILQYFTTTIITGTDTGSTMIKNIVPIVVAAAITIGALMGIGKRK